MNLNVEDLDNFARRTADQLGLHKFVLSLHPDETIHLASLVVSQEVGRSQGSGTEAMKRLIEFADKNDCRLTLSVGLKDDYHGTTSRARLVRFYKRFGFYENKGRNKDFSVSASMIREPEPTPELNNQYDPNNVVYSGPR